MDELTEPVGLKRVIACEKCGDTGVVLLEGPYGPEVALLGSCSCRVGQLPGVLAGVQETGA